ncbi:MAG: hypothetical protein LBK22_06710, partial [Tannerella sp.]|nr:hypothetical protein [Tannerella sp.]
CTGLQVADRFPFFLNFIFLFLFNITKLLPFIFFTKCKSKVTGRRQELYVLFTNILCLRHRGRRAMCASFLSQGVAVGLGYGGFSALCPCSIFAG